MLVTVAEMAEFRSAAEDLMVDTCRVTYSTGRSVQNESTGRQTTVYAERFVSKCKVQERQLTAFTPDTGGRDTTVIRFSVHLPVTVPEVHPDDVVEMTATGPASDVRLVGRKFRVIAPVSKTFTTATRLDVEEIV